MKPHSFTNNGWGSKTNDAVRRELTDLADASEGQVISGNKGYCLLRNATVEEVEHASARLISQGRKMVSRGIRQLRRLRSGK